MPTDSHDGTGTLPAKQPGSSSASDASCPNCPSTAAWGLSLWCPDCGWYPALNRCIDTGDRGEDSSGPANSWEPESPSSLLEVIPVWMWICLAGTVLTAAGTLVVGQLLPAAGNSRAVCTLGMMVLGVCVAGGVHVASFFVSIQKTDRIAPFDLLLKPVEIWKCSLVRLPQGAWRVCLLCWGTVAVVLAPLLIGGINWMGIVEGDWVEEKKPNMLQSVVAAARATRGGGADSLEDAMKDFTGEADAASGLGEAGDGEDEDGDGAAGTGEGEATEGEGEEGEDAEGEGDEEGAEGEEEDTDGDGIPDRKKAVRPLKEDCLIVGYTRSGEDVLDTLILAAAFNNQIRFAGRISTDAIPAATRNQLLARMRQMRRKTPFVRVPYEGEWLRPRMMIRVRFAEWSPTHRLVDAVFDAVLEDIR